jgi:hypothetical protein
MMAGAGRPYLASSMASPTSGERRPRKANSRAPLTLTAGSTQIWGLYRTLTPRLPRS